MRAASRIDEIADDEGATPVVILTDAETGIVRAMIVRREVIVGNAIAGSEVAVVNMILRCVIVDHDVTVGSGYALGDTILRSGYAIGVMSVGGGYALGGVAMGSRPAGAGHRYGRRLPGEARRPARQRGHRRAGLHARVPPA